MGVTRHVYRKQNGGLRLATSLVERPSMDRLNPPYALTIRTDNAAFDDDRCAETARILRDVADQPITSSKAGGLIGNRQRRF